MSWYVRTTIRILVRVSMSLRDYRTALTTPGAAAPVAASLLGDWTRRSAAFTKVMPRDYRRVLEAMRQARVEGRDVDEAIMEASRG